MTMHPSRSQQPSFAMQMPWQLTELEEAPLTWTDAELGYQKPPAENLRRLEQDVDDLRASWEAQYK